MLIRGGFLVTERKRSFTLIPSLALCAVADLMTSGEDTHAQPWSYYTHDDLWDKAQRHLWAIRAGERRDPETNQLHSVHAIADLMMLAERDLKG